MQRVFVLLSWMLMLLSACVRPQALFCGPEEACPRGYACQEGRCVQEEPTPCPAEPFPDPSLTAAQSMTCEYGQECCCGACHPSIVCTAAAGEGFSCFYTDACLVSSCGDCASDKDCANDQVCTPDRGGANVCVAGCRTDSSCPAGARCEQVECFTLPCPPVCVEQMP